MSQIEERDIDFVLVTGAGASREFGTGGTPLPLMADWAKFLVDKLWSAGPSYQEVTGLKIGMTGEEFEAQLGQFLRQVEGFSRATDLVEPSSNFPLQSGGAIPPQQLSDWHRQAVHHFGRITNVIHESLVELFNHSKINGYGAEKAYADLFEHLSIVPANRIVYATTNYDGLGEFALRRLGRLPDWGEPPRIAGIGESPLVVTDLLGGIGRYTPVLHLHGKVGWYRRADTGLAYSMDATQHDMGNGIPIAMLPDPQKSYAGDDVLAALWSQLTQALSRAKRVLVMGHSLSDTVLVQTLIERVVPQSRLAITVLADDVGEVHESAVAMVEKVTHQFTEASVIPFRFGFASASASPGFKVWLERDYR